MTNSCDVGKKHVSTSCDDLLDMPCSSQLDVCSTSMSCETNLLKENNELKREVKKLSNKLERCVSASSPLVGFGELNNNTIKGLTSLLSVKQEIEFIAYTCGLWNEKCI